MELLSYVSFIVLPFNLIGNSLVVLTTFLDHQRKTCTYLLMNLAIGDLCFGVAYLLVALFSELLSSYDSDVLCKVYGYVTYSTLGVSVLTLAAISLERFYVIVKPLHHYGRISNKTLKITVGIIWIGTNALVMPMMFFMKGKKEDSRYLYCMIGGVAEKEGRVYHPILGAVLILCPFLFICYFYSRIIYNLWVKPKQDATGTNQVLLRSRRKLTKLLGMVTVAFTVCLLPMAVTRVIDMIHKEKEYYLLNRWTMVLMCVHSSLNPLIYSLNNEGFRKGIIKILCCCGFCQVDSRARVQPFVTTQETSMRV